MIVYIVIIVIDGREMTTRNTLEQDNIKIIAELFDAHNKKDINRIRSLLCDDFKYKSPSASFSNADEFVDSLSGMIDSLDRTEIVKVIANGDEVVALQETSMLVSINGKTKMNAVEWYEIENGKVKSLIFLHDLIGKLEFDRDLDAA